MITCPDCDGHGGEPDVNLDCEVYLRGCDRCKGTGRIAEERMGICRACGEWTSLAESCCGAPVLIDGGWVSPDEEGAEA